MRSLARIYPYYYSTSNRGEAYSEEYQAVLDRATTEGITHPNASVNSALDTFLSARVADGSFTVLDRLFIFPSLLGDFAKISLVRPSTASLPTLVGQTTGGIQGNGTSTFTDTLYNATTEASANYIQDSASRGFWVYTAPTTGTLVDGHTTSINNRTAYANNLTHRINDAANLPSGVDLTGTGYKGMNRSGANDIQLYNGLTKSTRTTASDAIPNETFLLGRSAGNYCDVVVSMWFAGGSLTETQHNNMRNDFAALLTSLGL